MLRAKRLELDMNLYELLQNRLRFTRGRLVDARIWAIPSDAAAITLFDSFIPKSAGEPEQPDAEPSSFQVFFENIHIEHAYLYGSVPGLAGLRAENLDVRAHIRIKDIFQADVTSVKGQLLAPFSLPFELVHATTEVLTEPLRIRTRGPRHRESRQAAREPELHGSRARSRSPRAAGHHRTGFVRSAARLRHQPREQLDQLASKAQCDSTDRSTT